MRNFLLLAGLLSLTPATLAATPQSPPLPDAVVDLRAQTGAELVLAQWRFRDAEFVSAENRAPGGGTVPTTDITPHAGAKDFDDSAWPVIDPTSLETRRTNGRFAFGWYRLSVTLPERIGDTEVTGATLFLELVADDYAEVWVQGRLPVTLGQRGGPLVAGWNAPNRILLTDRAVPGQKFTASIFVANAPLSDPPANFIWLRSATLDVYRPGRAFPRETVETTITRSAPGMDRVVPPSAVVERLAEGFAFGEGPVWVPAAPGAATGGFLLFSDPNKNVIHRWSPVDGVSIYRTKSGYTGPNIGAYHQPGSNGLALDSQGRLTICEHGNRRVTRLEKNGAITVLADRYDGKRLNSPNDLVYRSDGALFFTDPPFGLPMVYDDPAKELPYSAVFCLIGDRLAAVATDLKGPNGLALSPDEKFLYVSNWDEHRKVVMRYEAAADGSLSSPTVFADMSSVPGEIALDGLKVDQAGNVLVSGPGGVWIFDSAGAHLGTISPPELPANFAWGDSDGRTLYMTARSSLYRIRLNTPGAVAR